MKTGSILFVAAAFSLGISGCSNEATLTANESVPVYESAQDARQADPARAIRSLDAGSSASLAECIDMKSVFVFRVVGPDGVEGYVVYGDFDLNRRPSCRDPD
jgi:hypothetical protein